jgi:hypothetical protein
MDNERLTAEQIRWYRLRRSGLVEPFPTPEEAARDLAGVQAQILSAAGLALWNRTPGLTYERFDALLHEERALIKIWGQRGTLHVYPTAEWPLIYAARQARPSWWERQGEKQGAAAYARLVEEVEALLRERGTLTRSELRAAELGLSDHDFSGWGGIFAHLVHQGVACHAGQQGNEGLFAHRSHWRPDLAWKPPTTEAANVELARRFFHIYGPATEQDFRYWRLARAANSRRWIATLGEALVEVAAEGHDAPLLALRSDLDALRESPPPPEGWPVRLLYRFDPLLLGIKDKGWLVEEGYYDRVWRPAGHIEGTVLEEGRIRGTWRYDRRGGGLAVTVYPFVTLSDRTRAAVEGEAQGVAAFFGMALRALEFEGRQTAGEV